MHAQNTVPNDGMASIHAYPIKQFAALFAGFSKRQNSIGQFHIVICVIFDIISYNIFGTMADSQAICLINSSLSTSKIFDVRSCIAKEGRQTQKRGVYVRASIQPPATGTVLLWHVYMPPLK